MHTINYFANLRTPEEIKKRYFELAKQHHPDHGGDVATMQEINRQFADALQRAASGRAEGEEQQHARRECPADFVAIIDKLIRLDGLTLEIVGSWLWISGATYAHREEVKSPGIGTPASTTPTNAAAPASAWTRCAPVSARTSTPPPERRG